MTVPPIKMHLTLFIDALIKENQNHEIRGISDLKLTVETDNCASHEIISSVTKRRRKRERGSKSKATTRCPGTVDYARSALSFKEKGSNRPCRWEAITTPSDRKKNQAHPAMLPSNLHVRGDIPPVLRPRRSNDGCSGKSGTYQTTRSKTSPQEPCSVVSSAA